MASIDVVVPCYNYAHFLKDCVASILSQRDVEVRVLILDDASPDNTQQIGEALAASDPRVTYQKNKQNLGLIGTANRGLLDWAQADYALLLSADDLLTQGSLARATALMETHKDVHLVFGRALLIDDAFDRTQLPEDAGTPDYKVLQGRDFIKRNFTHGNPVASPTAVVRTRVQQALGGYLPQFYHTSDMEMWMRFAARGPIGVIKSLQAGYRLHGASMSAPKINRAISDREECFETCKFVTETWCKALPEAQDWLIQMQRRMATEVYWRAALSKYSPEERRVCAAFAKRVDPDGPLSLRRLKFELKKRLLQLKPQSESPEDLEYFPRTSDIYGWWPGDD
ncbi:MAG: glycosyltransferase [Hyphomonadaceae bacterium]|nr:glycosyltransferase [Hyphomonadaceae bacterium]